MPEGHTIHRLAADLAESIADDPVVATSPQGRFEPGARLIDGERLLNAEAYGKYLFCSFGPGTVLHVHLGLIGKFRPHPPSERAGSTVRLRLETENIAWHLIGPARCEVLNRSQQLHIVRALGADPLRPNPKVDLLRERLRVIDRPIGAVLLDQRLIAGIGNVYRAEILFICGIHPLRPASSLSDDEFASMWEHTRRLLRRGVRLNRIVTTEPREIGRSLERMRRDDSLYVYHRDRCRRCGTELTTIEVGGRPLQFCSSCQPMGAIQP